MGTVFRRVLRAESAHGLVFRAQLAMEPEGGPAGIGLSDDGLQSHRNTVLPESAQKGVKLSGAQTEHHQHLIMKSLPGALLRLRRDLKTQKGTHRCGEFLLLDLTQPDPQLEENELDLPQLFSLTDIVKQYGCHVSSPGKSISQNVGAGKSGFLPAKL